MNVIISITWKQEIGFYNLIESLYSSTLSIKSYHKLNWLRKSSPLGERTQDDDDAGKRELTWIV